MSDLDAMKAAFITKGGTVTLAAPAAAYGVDPAADKANRLAARAYQEAWNYERDAERRSERVREAYHTGGRGAAIEALQGERCHDHTRED